MSTAEERRRWLTRFLPAAVAMLHDINNHVRAEQNAPVPPDNSWLALEGCRHPDCRIAREYLAATPSPDREADGLTDYQRGYTDGFDAPRNVKARAALTTAGTPGIDVERIVDAALDLYVREEASGSTLPPGVYGAGGQMMTGWVPVEAVAHLLAAIDETPGIRPRLNAAAHRRRALAESES